MESCKSVWDHRRIPIQGGGLCRLQVHFEFQQSMGNMITKERILQKSSSWAILNHYLRHENPHGFPYSADLQKGKLVPNPFLPQKQTTPSFNIHPAKSGEWQYHDFATGEHGSCFDLVMRLFRIDFNAALDRINTDLHLGL